MIHIASKHQFILQTFFPRTRSLCLCTVHTEPHAYPCSQLCFSLGLCCSVANLYHKSFQLSGSKCVLYSQLHGNFLRRPTQSFKINHYKMLVSWSYATHNSKSIDKPILTTRLISFYFIQFPIRFRNLPDRNTSLYNSSQRTSLMTQVALLTWTVFRIYPYTN